MAGQKSACPWHFRCLSAIGYSGILGPPYSQPKTDMAIISLSTYLYHSAVQFRASWKQLGDPNQLITWLSYLILNTVNSILSSASLHHRTQHVSLFSVTFTSPWFDSWKKLRTWLQNNSKRLFALNRILLWLLFCEFHVEFRRSKSLFTMSSAITLDFVKLWQCSYA